MPVDESYVILFARMTTGASRRDPIVSETVEVKHLLRSPLPRYDNSVKLGTPSEFYHLGGSSLALRFDDGGVHGFQPSTGVKMTKIRIFSPHLSGANVLVDR